MSVQFPFNGLNHLPEVLGEHVRAEHPTAPVQQPPVILCLLHLLLVGGEVFFLLVFNLTTGNWQLSEIKHTVFYMIQQTSLNESLSNHVKDIPGQFYHINWNLTC